VTTVHTAQELAEFAEWERAAWEDRAASYAASLGDLTQGSIAPLLDSASVQAGTRLLDVGTGPGYVALAAAERGARVRAVDQAAAMVHIARAAGVDAYQASAQDLPFDDRDFDAVVGSYVLNHLPRPEATMRELERVLDTGGRLALTVWDAPSQNPSTGLFGPVIAELGLTDVVPPGPDSQRFSDDAELRRLLRGWDDVSITRPRWTFDVEPGAWFDAIATGTPRAGAVLAQAAPAARARARERFVELATERYGIDNGLIALPAGAVLVSATKPAA
jgi:SAM-dependent methyltransferase